jgi:hypothetical protein
MNISPVTELYTGYSGIQDVMFCKELCMNSVLSTMHIAIKRCELGNVTKARESLEKVDIKMSASAVNGRIICHRKNDLGEVNLFPICPFFHKISISYQHVSDRLYSVFILFHFHTKNHCVLKSMGMLIVQKVHKIYYVSVTISTCIYTSNRFWNHEICIMQSCMRHKYCFMQCILLLLTQIMTHAPIWQFIS